MLRRLRALAILALALWILASPQDVGGQSCGGGIVNTNHPAQCDASGKLIPWVIDASGPFHYIMSIEAQWWLRAPSVNGWPTYLTAAELNRSYSQYGGAVPGSTVSMAINAYLKYYAYTGSVGYLDMLRTMGDYILQQDLTPQTYAYARFPWAVGSTGDITPDGSGQNANSPGNIMPDKGAMIGIALLHLWEATGNIAYRDEAVQIANVLADTAVPGSATQSRWPLRVYGNSGAFVDGRVSGNQVFALRLFDELIRLGLVGNGKYQTTRDNVWNWLKNVAIADSSGDKWMHFFEDHSGTEYNPTQFDALEMARYLLERKDALDPDWFSMAGSLINLVKTRWVVHSGDYTAIGEQQRDMTPYNSHTARYASILAKYYEAGGPAAYKDEAYSSFAYSTYSVDVNGFADTSFNSGIAWSTDSFGDWLQHFMDGLGAIPDWAPANSDHLLRSSSVVQTITYGSSSVSYTTFDAAGQEKLKLTFTPTSVLVAGVPITSWSWDSVNHVLAIDRTTGTAVEISGEGIMPTPDFTISVTPGSQSVIVGSGTAYTASTVATGGFTGTVNLSVTGLPAGATAAFSPASVTGSGSSTLNLTTSSTTPIGAYTLTIAGTSGNLSHTANATLTVTGSSTTITFDDISPASRVLTGQYPTGIIDWGSGTSWYLSGPWGLFTTQSVSFTSGRTSANFTFLSNSGLAGLQAYNGGSASATVTISCSGQPNVQASLAAGTVRTINTGWATPCSIVTLATTNFDNTNFDNLVTFTASPAAPDFSLSATPGSRSVVQGSSTSYTATVSALNAFNGVTSFSVTGLPSGANGTFSPTSVTGSGSSTLNVTTSSTTPTGSYTVTMTGTSGSLSHSASVTLVVNATPPVTGDLVAAFGFGEGSGTTVSDASGNGNNGTILNATWTTAGRYGSALLFNGSNAWVTVADSASLDLTTAMTIEAWVRPTAAMGTSWRSIILKERPSGLSYSLYTNTTSGRPGPYINTGGADLNVRGTSSVPADAWTHLAATYNGTMLQLYVNGTLVKSASFPGALVVSSGVLRIGGNSVWGEWFKGYIDEVRIYKRALSAAEIVNDMNNPVVP